MTAVLSSSLNVDGAYEGKLTLTSSFMKESSLRCMPVLMAISLYSSIPKQIRGTCIHRHIVRYVRRAVWP